MTPEFDYFFWGLSHNRSYALFDGLDNHFYMVNDNFELLYNLSLLLKSKIMLEIVELPETDLDNTVIHQWGMSNRPDWVYADVFTFKKYYGDSTNYYRYAVIRNADLVETKVEFDPFKQDVQKQIFLLYNCIQHQPSEDILKRLRLASSMCTSYDDLLNQIVDVSDILDKELLMDYMNFLRKAGLFYA